jgi:RimJ/RimL family protein N-acetyltransferase
VSYLAEKNKILFFKHLSHFLCFEEALKTKIKDMTRTILETERLFLREVSGGDENHMAHFFSDEEAMRFFPSEKHRVSPEEWVHANITSYKEHGYGLYALLFKKEMVFTGYCGFLFQENVDGADEIEIAYGLLNEYRRQGLAIEAAIACREYGFYELNIKRLISLIAPGNKPSIRVAEKMGMHPEKIIERWGMPHQLFRVTPDDLL